MTNPSITELKNETQFELIAELNHQQIKDFVMARLMENGKLIRVFMIYQAAMVLLGIFFITRSIMLAFQHTIQPLVISVGSLIFCFTFLVIIHELLHGLAMKITGAPKINFGGYLRKFIFYAEADRHVLNRKQFALVALTPLVVVKVVSLVGIIFTFHQPMVYFWIILMCTHSLFCAGDIGLLSLFYHEKDEEIFTYDVREEKKSYFYRRISGRGLS